MLFKTERLTVERIREGDHSVFLQVYSDVLAIRWVGDGQPIRSDEARRWVDVTLENYRIRGYGMMKISSRDTCELVGCCGIVHPDGQLVPEIKYCFLRQFLGKGFATETVNGVLEYGKKTHHIDTVLATVAPENEPSKRVLMKCGFLKGDRSVNEDGEFTDRFYRGDREYALAE